MTILNKNFKYERLLEQAAATSVSICYRDYANAVQYKRGLGVRCRHLQTRIHALKT